LFAADSLVEHRSAGQANNGGVARPRRFSHLTSNRRVQIDDHHNRVQRGYFAYFRDGGGSAEGQIETDPARQPTVRRSGLPYAELKEAATRYLEEQIGVLFAVREAQDVGLDTERWAGWLDMPAERAVIEARVDMDREDEVHDQRENQVDAALFALRRAGYEPLRPEDVVIGGGEST
jgi:hypothetical protein